MNKTVIYSPRQITPFKGVENLLSLAEVAHALGVTRMTVYKWVYLGVLIFSGSQKIGKKTFYWFDPRYIDEVGKVLGKNRGVGKMILDDKKVSKIKEISSSFFSKRG